MDFSEINEKIDRLMKQFIWHNHADGYTQPVFLGQLTQGTSHDIKPVAGGILGETIANGDALMIGTDGKIHKADASSQANCDRFVGIAIQSQASGENALYISSGFKTDYTGLAVGSVYYLSNTSGVISTSPGSYTKRVGIAVSDNTMLIINN